MSEVRTMSHVLYAEIQRLGEQSVLDMIRARERRLAKQREKYESNKKILEAARGTEA